MRNWKNIFIRLALIAVVICLLPSCGGLSGQKASLPTPYPAGIRPLLLAIYHPYPDFSNLPTEVSPLPSYTGWTVHRMERDLARMRDVGFDGVLLAITLDTDISPCKSSELDTENLIFCNFIFYFSYSLIAETWF